MDKNKILIIGTGPVGLATAIGFAHYGFNVKCYDIDTSRISLLKSGITPFYEEGLQKHLDNYSNKLSFTDNVMEAFKYAKYCFISVGTPIGNSGEIDMYAFWQAVDLVCSHIINDGIIVIKSTVPIGTNRKVKMRLAELGLQHRIDVVSNPEFLAQGTSIIDTINPSRIVIGSNSKEAQIEILRLYENCSCEKILTNPESAEMIKYESNCYLAMRLSFVNDLATTCSLVGADVQTVLRGVSSDIRIGDKYFSPSIGYGGSCFPKDTVAFHNQIQKEYGYELELIEATVDINKRQCLYLCRKIINDFGSIVGKKVAILGVAFKKHTDDVRNSLAIDNIKFLKENGACVTVWDPRAETNCRMIFADTINYEKSLECAIIENDIILIMTDWDDIINMPSHIFNGKSVYDSKNIFINNKTIEFNYTYIGGENRRK